MTTTPDRRRTPRPGPGAGRPWAPGGPTALDEVLTGLTTADADPVALLEKLESAHAALRVADEEARVQRDQIAALLAERRASGLQRQWLAGLLPVPMLVTDRAGVVTSANSAAARLLRIALLHLLRKPLVGFVHEDDRGAVLGLLPGAGEGTARGRVRLLPRRSDAVEVDLVVTGDGWAGGEDELAWTLLAGPEAGSPVDGAGGAGSEPLLLAAGFVEMCALPAQDLDPRALLQRVATVVERALPGTDAVSVELGSAAAPTALASTSPVADELDGLQVQTGQGPCVTAPESHETVLTGDVSADPRWPRLAARARAAAARSVVAVPLVVDGEPAGAINCYATRTAAYGEAEVQTAELLAAAAGAVLAEVRQKQRLRDLAGQLDEALRSRAVIDEAKGIVMARRGGTPDEAFAFLARLSQQRNVKVRDLAASIVEQTAAHRPAGPAA
ncbi:ANTAR domain-containing protein [Cellulomonas endophytica]|uniref:ANTAR domain-containing protein n=1 Tax=Cellulomonas endophytica TaxID=2494735 RepID=UPI001010BFDB|nr:ANTAR domain-containing protein [Cellulomonas endophytica]